jgi:hypothetical protein
MFLTGAAPNPIVRAKADAIFDIDLTFASWLKGAAVPGLLSILLVPLLLYYLIKPHQSKQQRQRQSQSSSHVPSSEKKENDSVEDIHNANDPTPSPQPVLEPAPPTSLREWASSFLNYHSFILMAA